jgi:hypothetical protein
MSRKIIYKTDDLPIENIIQNLNNSIPEQMIDYDIDDIIEDHLRLPFPLNEQQRIELINYLIINANADNMYPSQVDQIDHIIRLLQSLNNMITNEMAFNRFMLRHR